MINGQKYIFTLLITASVFAVAIILNNYFDDKRVLSIQSIQNTISSDLQSNDVQYQLLSELTCREVSVDILSKQINDLGQKIEFTEQNLGTDSSEIIKLKKQYSILEAKDYILMRRINERCGKRFMFAFYFYGKKEDCEDCNKASIALTELRKNYPELRVYSFDYGLDDPTIRTLIEILDVKNTLPAIVIGDVTNYGFKEKGALEEVLKKTYPKEIAAIEAERKKIAEEEAAKQAEQDAKSVNGKQ